MMLECRFGAKKPFGCLKCETDYYYLLIFRNPAYWLGIHNLEVYPSARFTASLQTGQPLTFDKWDTGRPKSDGVRCGTVKKDNNKWRDERCHLGSQFYGVLCRLPMQPSPIDSNTGKTETNFFFRASFRNVSILT